MGHRSPYFSLWEQFLTGRCLPTSCQHHIFGVVAMVAPHCMIPTSVLVQVTRWLSEGKPSPTCSAQLNVHVSLTSHSRRRDPLLGHAETQAFSISKLCLPAGLSTCWPRGGEHVSPRRWAWKWCTSLLPRTQLYSHFVLAAGRAKKCSLATSPRRQENGRGRTQSWASGPVE